MIFSLCYPISRRHIKIRKCPISSKLLWYTRSRILHTEFIFLCSDMFILNLTSVTLWKLCIWQCFPLHISLPAFLWIHVAIYGVSFKILMQRIKFCFKANKLHDDHFMQYPKVPYMLSFTPPQVTHLNLFKPHAIASNLVLQHWCFRAKANIIRNKV